MESSPRTYSLEALRSHILCVLIIESNDEEAARLERALTQERAVADVCRVHYLAEAQTLLANACFDVVVISDARLDGKSVELLQHLQQRHVQVPVVVLASEEASADVLATMEVGACHVVTKGKDEEHLRVLPLKVMEVVHHHLQQRPMTAQEDEQVRLLETIRVTAATLKHEINNPLAIILGNAQLLLELAHYNDLEPDLVQSIQDIEEASRRISTSIDKLATLRELVTRAYVNSGEDLIDLPSGPSMVSHANSSASHRAGT